MRRFVLYLIFIVSFLHGNLNGQVTGYYAPDVLENLYARLANNRDDSIRIRINDSINVIVNTYVRSDSIFTHGFSNLRYLGQITSPDSLVKIVTWNLVLTNLPSRYYCYIIRREQPGSEHKIYSLSSEYNEKQLLADTTYHEADWYGALYYDIRPCLSDTERSWILLGIDYGNPFVSRKIIDVLSFNPDKSIVFGKKWFISGDYTKFREVFEYSSAATMTLRFSSDSSVVFDHLVPFSRSHTDDRQFYGPDYSYDAFTFENNYWRMSVNVEARNKE